MTLAGMSVVILYFGGAVLAGVSAGVSDGGAHPATASAMHAVSAMKWVFDRFIIASFVF
jgi:hypothetical protein